MKSTSRLDEWVAAWARARPALEAVKRAELRRLKTAPALAQLADHFRYARRTAPPTRTSGLVEQQRIFQKLRRG